MKCPQACWLWLGLALLAGSASAEAPSTSYIFPAGGQRGTAVPVRVGGHYLHERASWEVAGAGIRAEPELVRTERIWFEGPLIRQPASQQSENYPQDYQSRIEIASDASPGPRLWRAWNAQGMTAPLAFIVGDLPEVVEKEIDGRPIPVEVSLPVTINGRIFPREDVDVWTFRATPGQTVTCSVAAAELGSPLEPHLEVRDPQGRTIAESSEPQLRFVADVAGVYEVRLTDCRFAGLQNYVYRLTVTAEAWIDRVFPLGGRRNTEVSFEVSGQKVPATVKSRLPDVPPGVVRQALEIDRQRRNVVLLDIDEYEEVLEPPSGPLPVAPAPGVANGRIRSPGERDRWTFTGKKDAPLTLEVRAARLGSPLDSVLAIYDASGKEIATGDDAPDSPDATATFTPPADGNYTAEVREKFASRGGEAFAYRLRVTPAQADFRLAVPSESLGIDSGAEKKLPVTVERLGGFQGPITLRLDCSSAVVSAKPVTVAPNQNRAEITLKVAKDAPVQIASLAVIGEAAHDGQPLERRAVVAVGQSSAGADRLWLAVTLPTPFRFRGEYEFRYVPRGGVLRKTFRVERAGYEGPLEVRLADRQGRHLQGVTGPTITVPAGKDEFTYTLALPPWMELGRTSRTNLMITGEVADAAGKRHKVCFATTEQNEQLIALVSPAPLRLSLKRSALPCKAGGELVVPVQIHRDPSLAGPVKLELVLPAHVRDVQAAPVVVAAEGTTAQLRLKIGSSPGPLNLPLVIRGTSEHHGHPMVAETPLALIPAP